MKPNPLPFLLERWHGVLKPTARFTGKNILITGANTGIGFEAAAQYAAFDAEKIILAVRDTRKGEIARQKINSRTPAADIEVWHLDMNSFASIQDFATRVDETLPHLDIAILNAGVTTAEHKSSPEGWESHLQVNVLGRALLGLLLLQKLQASTRLGHSTSHLLIVTSEAHRWLEAKDIPDPTAFDSKFLLAMNDPQNFEPFIQYARSKLLALYIARSLADLAADADVIVTAVCPGACKSELMRDMQGQSYAQTIQMKLLHHVFSKPTEQGGWCYIWASLLGEEGRGAWFKTSRLVEPGELVAGPGGAELQSQAWEEIVEVLSAKVPRVREIAQGR